MGVLKNLEKFMGKHLCWSLLFNKDAGERPAMFSCEFCQNTFYTEHFLVTASAEKKLTDSLKFA